jgi:progesterone-induced-blocking factor 1
VEYLREAKEEADVRCSKLDQDLKDKTNAYDDLLVEYRGAQGKLEQQIIELRSELRLKTDELERTLLKFEDMVTGVRTTKAENEMLKDKVDILKQEFYKLEHRNKSESAELKASYAVCKEKLAQYEAMERDIDNAIVNQGVELNAPTAAKRRMKQSLELSSKL